MQPLVITLTGLFVLWVFILPYILPGLECFGVINLTQSLLKGLFDCHLLIQSLTLRSKNQTYFSVACGVDWSITVLPTSDLYIHIYIYIHTYIYIYYIYILYTQGGPQKCPYFSLAITFTKVRKPSRSFLHRYWKFIELFWWKPLYNQ